MRLTSIESSFHPCNIYRDCTRSVPSGGQNVQKLTHVPLALSHPSCLNSCCKDLAYEMANSKVMNWEFSNMQTIHLDKTRYNKNVSHFNQSVWLVWFLIYQQ